MRHDIGIRWHDGRREERGINFVAYGQPASTNGHSAMALTVGFPAAIAAKMIVDGEIQERGVVSLHLKLFIRYLYNKLNSVLDFAIQSGYLPSNAQ